jgi:dTDP-4-amino-4,6-dideoxygalactose transaminase
LRAHLKACGISTLVQWGGKAVHQWEKLGFGEKLPFTEKLFEQMLLLPLNMSLADDDVNQVSDAIHDFYRQ